jgi:DNA-binding transcriptional MocR family regulator
MIKGGCVRDGRNEKVSTAGAAADRTDRAWRLVAWRSAALLREQVVSSGMSFMTVSHAYQLLESQGRIVARPQSGYYVAPQPVKLRQPAPPAQVTRDEAVDINTYIFEVLQASRRASMLPLPRHFPTRAVSAPAA